MDTRNLTRMPKVEGEHFFKHINADGDCVGVLKTAPGPIQEFFFIDTEPYEELSEDMTRVVRRVIPLENLRQEPSTRVECETLLEFHRAAGEVWLR